MFTGEVDVISNKATWRSQVYELVDDTDDTTTDLTTVVGLAIVVTIKDLPDCNYIRVTGSIVTGEVTVPGPGFQWQFEDTDLSSLCPGTYGLGVKVTINGFIIDLIDGTITVIQGN